MSDSRDQPEPPSIAQRLLLGASQKPVYLVLVVVLLVLAVGFLVAGVLFVVSLL